AELVLSPGCCGESGMGAITSPEIYNRLRERKIKRLKAAMGEAYDGVFLVSCPSCKIGIARCLINLKRRNHVVHVAEFLAGVIDGEDRRQSFRRRVQEARGEVRVVQLGAPASAPAKPAAKSVDKGSKPAL
ncbi:MAG: (Fe-S)-binding protein, partial [Desulfovibrio sp.]|nr:(Fe-S)-binding protein [Desulfovibrio sp.]